MSPVEYSMLYLAITGLVFVFVATLCVVRARAERTERRARERYLRTRGGAR